jgi:hypothetical protein
MNSEPFTSGTPRDTALALLKTAFHEGLLSVRDSWWFPHREEWLRVRLSDPITADQAQALRDVVCNGVHLDEPIRWLDKHQDLTWQEFQDMRARIAEAAMAARAEWERQEIIRARDRETERAKRPPTPTPFCPTCERKDQVVPIVYGLPGGELIESGRRREVVLGGCMGGSDQWFCKACEKGFE